MLSIQPGSNNITHKGVLNKICDSLPIVGGLGAVGLAAYDVYKAKPEEKKEHFLRNMFILTTIAIVSGLLLKKWMGDHSIIEKLFHKAEGAMEHISVHTAKEGSEIVKSARALKNVATASRGKVLPEIEALIKRTLPEESERILNVLCKKSLPKELEMMALLRRSLPATERSIMGSRAGQLLNIKA